MAATIDALLRSDAVHRAAYVDPGVFALEESRIFRRVWLYVAHESEVARAGDYVLRRMGPEEVVLVRREDGGLSLLYNRCAHRGARLVTQPQGSLRQFRCSYHAWTYRLDGSLAGVPLARMLRHVSAIEAAPGGEGCDHEVRSSLIVAEWREGESRWFAGRVLHRLRREAAGLRIVLKRVDLISSEAPQRALAVPF